MHVLIYLARAAKVKGAKQLLAEIVSDPEELAKFTFAEDKFQAMEALDRASTEQPLLVVTDSSGILPQIVRNIRKWARKPTYIMAFTHESSEWAYEHACQLYMRSGGKSMRDLMTVLRSDIPEDWWRVREWAGEGPAKQHRVQIIVPPPGQPIKE